jgi:uncharacterized protein with von Willebrand factor type A (vWA) domain
MGSKQGLSKRKQRKIKIMRSMEKQVEKIENLELKRSCTYGLNMLNRKYPKEQVSPARKITLNRTPEEWNKLIQQAKS